MKNFYNILAAIALCSPIANAAEIEPSYGCFENGSLVYYPIETVWVVFSGAMELSEEAEVVIEGQEGIVAAAPLQSKQYGNSAITETELYGTFDAPLTLEKGRSYVARIPGSILRRVDDAEATNTPIALVFSIPDYLPKAHTGISDGGNAESSQSLRFDFPTEIQTVGETSMLLYREGELIQEIPCHVSWDWDLGCVWPDLKTPIQFEEGVAYTAVLPENSVCSLYREDIWNQEQTISFVGGYQEPAPEISCIWCSLWYERLGDTLGEVRFGFGQEVALSEDPSVQLWTADMGSLLKEVVPTLETSESMWILVADFGGYPLDGLASGFIIVVPEGTLVTPSGEAANSRSEVRIDESNSVASMRQDSAVVNVSGNHLTIRSIPQGEQVCVYSADGVLEAMSARAADTLEVRLANGVHILRIGNKAYKIKI